ncbi:uncharacterized protein PHACADRAFT_189362 [Phanerochaete carnosa HHB-10118-sp]|uniref:Uncharacterized protein n=1 Tax=Phanerochaete carnosa (strain HHB-10118-sp) TaxID=650164 RepID=K5XB98_PHACS|nr:uncharacterized protein PHACADRAFT_189362 [Phanerochaete carnosa HHB-10118-sp]EKM60227.1 hypothetical protein PHACADRAFT_189362 [Phanerochaete carnosa HHB-10118-sp]
MYLTDTVLISASSTLRVYALWQSSRMKYVFPAVVFMLGTVPVGTNIVNSIRTSVFYVDTPLYFGCSEFFNMPPKLDTECTTPQLLVQRFILNLRQFNHAAEASENSSDAQHFSRFSVNFRVPSDFLGNIKNPLDHGPPERAGENGEDGHCVAEETRDEFEASLSPQAGPDTTHQDSELTGASITRVPRFSECASEGGSIGFPAYSRELGE